MLTLVQNLVAQIAAIPPSTDPVTQAALDALTATLIRERRFYRRSGGRQYSGRASGERKALIWECGSGCLGWRSGPFFGLHLPDSETFVCDDCGEEKPRLGSMKLVPIDQTAPPHFVCADCVKNYDIHKPN